MTINASAQSHIKVDLNGNIRVPQIHKDIEPFVYNLESGSYVFYVITDNKTRLKAVFDHNYKQITGFLYDGNPQEIIDLD